MFGLCGIMAFIQLVGMSTMPESPVWLQQQGRLEERQAVLRIVYEGDEQQIPTDDESQGELKYIQGSPKSPSGRQIVPAFLDIPVLTVKKISAQAISLSILTTIVLPVMHKPMMVMASKWVALLVMTLCSMLIGC